MGVYTYGSAEFEFSRALTEAERIEWVEKAKLAEFTGPWSYPEGALREVGHEFEFDTDSYGDIGVFHTLDGRGLSLTVEGKVYDFVPALNAVFSVLPADVWVTGGGSFETEGDHWEVVAHGRKVTEGGGRVLYDSDLDPVRGALDTAEAALNQALSGFSHGRPSTGFKALKKATEALATAKGGLS